MDFGLKGKVALVFGSSKGLGKACAHELSKEGAKVILASRNKERLIKTKDEIGAHDFYLCDQKVIGDANRVVENIIEKYGAIDILVTNSGGPPNGKFDDISLSVWQEQYQNLFLSCIEAIKGVLPKMKEKKWGRILMVTSVTAKEPINNLTVSNVLRPGLLGLVKTLSNEIAENGITINALLPGYTMTERLKELGVDEKKISQNIPVGRPGKPNEFASLACFLASEKASYITGQMMAVDGGLLKSI